VAPSVTAPSTPRLSEAARHVVIPKGIVTTAWPRVVAQCEDMGVSFDAWQHGIGSAALGKRRDGKYAATVGGIVLSIPRQVGKTFLVGMIVIALCVLFPGMTVLWSAHRTKTATKTFNSLKAMTGRKKIKPFMLDPRLANGEQEIRFRNGSVIMFGAREQGFGRGFDEVDIEVFDEAQILTEKALEDMVPAANQSRQPSGALLFFMGTPPRPADPGEEFTNRRTKALSGKADNMLYVEFSADDEADPDDQAQWRKANPSYPFRTPQESMERMRENLTDDASFKREALGIWDAVGAKGVIPGPSWVAQGQQHSIAVDRFALGVECGRDLAWASVAFAGQRADDKWHFELDEDQHTKGRGVSWLRPHLAYLMANNSAIRAIVVDVAGPIAALLIEVKQQGGPSRWFFKGDDGKPDKSLEVTPVKVVELGTGCTEVLSGIVNGSLHHIDQPQFTAAALAAGKRPLGDTGMWVWSRKMAESDITPIQAATLALIGAQNANVKKPTRKGGGRRVVAM
jgi:hypothetical protein